MKLPPKSCLKWINQGNRKPDPDYPIIDCKAMFTDEDIEETSGVDSASKIAYKNKPYPYNDCDQDVYFVKAEGINNVKIGKARWSRIFSRLRDMRTGSSTKLSIILLMDCHCYEAPLSIEFRLHELFKAYRVHGEWFRIEGELLEFLKASGAQYE